MTKHKILVVDADQDMCKMLDIYFTGLGYDVITVKTGEEGLEFVLSALPDVIILEIHLPDMSGYDVCRELRTNTRTKHIPVIFMIEKSVLDNLRRGGESGADDYVSKPFDLEELKLRIGNIMRSYVPKTQHHDSGLPNQQGLEAYLKNRTASEQQIILHVQFTIQHYQQFKTVYGWQAGAEVHRLVEQRIQDLINREDNFIVHMPDDSLLLLTTAENPATLIDNVIKTFDEEIMMHYSFIDRDRGYMLIGDEEIPFMSLVYEMM